MMSEKEIIEKKIHYEWPIITDKTREAVLKQLNESISIYNRSGIIERLEDRLAKYFERKYALLTNSGTVALYSMYLGAGISEGDEVICPAYNFFACVTPLLFCRATPVLVDCDDVGNIDTNVIESKITPRTKGIVVTHMWGHPCNMKKIVQIAKKHKLLLFEDGSHAHGAEFEGVKIGKFGDAAAFSLQGQKTLTAGEGGVLLTDNPDIYHRALLLGHYNKRCLQEIPNESIYHRFAVTGLGLKFRIHPIAAAIADEQLDELDNILKGRQEIAMIMTEALKTIPGLSVVRNEHDIKHSWYAFVFKYDEKVTNIPIHTFYNRVHSNGGRELDCPTSTCPLNLLPLFQEPSMLFANYKNGFSYKVGDFPKAEDFYSPL